MSTRERLLDAAIRCLASEGWARTTTRRIISLARAHPPDINYYFGSKQALMHQAAVQVTRRWAQGPLRDASEISAEQISGGGISAEPAPEHLTLILDRFLAALAADRSDAVAALEAFAQAERAETLRDDLAAAYAQFRTAVTAAITGRGAAAGPEAGALASALIALFDGLAIQWLLDPRALPAADELVTALGRLFETPRQTSRQTPEQTSERT